MENNAIGIWDHLVCDTLHPVKLKTALTENGKIDAFLEQSREAKEQVRTDLIMESLQRKTEQENKILVERFQFFFGNLLETITEYQLETTLPFELQKLYEQVATDLEFLIHFLEESFFPYFNFNCK